MSAKYFYQINHKNTEKDRDMTLEWIKNGLVG
jgi:hypothetical protein